MKFNAAFWWFWGVWVVVFGLPGEDANTFMQSVQYLRIFSSNHVSWDSEGSGVMFK